jgi:hypothetical protein
LSSTSLIGSAGLPPVEQRGSVIVLPNDDTISPHNRPFNLENKTVRFVPDGDSFTAATTELTWDDARGTAVTLDPVTRAAAYDIKTFDFPFMGATARRLYVSRFGAIYLDPPPAPSPLRQYTDAELFLESRRIIAPFLTTTLGQTNFLPPKVYIKEAADRVVVTWAEDTRKLGIQAILAKTGAIEFNYRSIAAMRGGALLITSGSEAWREPQSIVSSTDAVNDFQTSNPPDIAAMMDMTSASIARIGNTNILQAVIRVRSPILRDKLPQGLGLTIYLSDSSALSATIAPDPAEDRLVGVQLATTAGSTLMQVEGDKIVLTFPQERVLSEPSSSETIVVALANESGGDTITLAGPIGPVPRPMRTDFAASTTFPRFSGPISDAFTLPFSNSYAAWTRVQEKFHFNPEEIDGVAVFQSFLTLGNPAASVGNPGVDNIGYGANRSTQLPREPNVFDMHALHILWNTTDDNASLVMLHEFGHRWVTGVDFMTADGKRSGDLFADGHPLTTTDTRAAFPVLHSYDCSVMGGQTWTDSHDGTFVGPEDTCGAGYSWLDLYLMGLASPEEIPSMFYLTNSVPPILEAPIVEGETFAALKQTVTIQQITNAMKPRIPAYPDTQRVFRVVFVLVYDPVAGLLESDVANMAHLAELFRQRFATATGNRGSIMITPAATDIPRRRSVQH